MPQRLPPVIRPVKPEDKDLFDALERSVWIEKGIPTIPGEIYDRWIKTHPDGFDGAFDPESGAMLAVIYAEVINFSAEMIDTPEWRAIVDAGYHQSVHREDGNTWYVLTIERHPGTRGTLGLNLLRDAMRKARQRGKRALGGICRMPGFSRYLTLCGHVPTAKNQAKTRKLALWYAVQCVRLVRGTLGPRFKHWGRPQSIPRLTEIDPVLGPFSYLGLVLHDVTPFIEDPESAHHGAVIAIDLTPSL